MLPLALVHRVSLFGEPIKHAGQTFAESLHERILFASGRTFGRNFDGFIHFDDHFERAMNAGSVGEVLLQSFYGFENASVGRWRVKIFWGIGRNLRVASIGDVTEISKVISHTNQGILIQDFRKCDKPSPHDTEKSLSRMRLHGVSQARKIPFAEILERMIDD
jgi:hypothetical protein